MCTHNCIYLTSASRHRRNRCGLNFHSNVRLFCLTAKKYNFQFFFLPSRYIRFFSHAHFAQSFLSIESRDGPGSILNKIHFVLLPLCVCIEIQGTDDGDDDDD